MIWADMIISVVIAVVLCYKLGRKVECKRCHGTGFERGGFMCQCCGGHGETIVLRNLLSK